MGTPESRSAGRAVARERGGAWKPDQSARAQKGGRRRGEERRGEVTRARLAFEDLEQILRRVDLLLVDGEDGVPHEETAAREGAHARVEADDAV